jgi:competence protein ComEC
MSTSLLLAIATTAGAAAGLFLDASIIAAATWLAAAFVLLAFVSAARGFFKVAQLLVVATFVPLTALIAAHAQDRAMRPPLRLFLDDHLGGYAIDSGDVARHETPVEIEGRLMSDAILTDTGASLRVDVERVAAGGCLERARGGVALSVSGTLAAAEVDRWRAGRVIRTTAILQRPARYLDAGVPDLERLLARRGIALVGTVKSGALVHVIENGSPLDEAASTVRAAVRRAIMQHVGSRDPQSAAIAVAILIGDRGGLDPLVEQRLQEAGTYHVIAISGGNIAIVAGIVLGLCWLVRVRGSWAAGAAIGLLSAYAYVAGGGPSVIRATVMANIYLALRLIDMKTAPLHAISVTLVAVLLATPLAITDVGLWLTFGATAAIIAAGLAIPLPASRWLRPLAALCLASLAAEVILIPIVAMVFQRVTVAGLVVNLAAIPSMAVAQMAAMVTAASDAIGVPAVAHLAGWITHLAVRVLIDSARLVDLAPWLTWRVPSPPLLVMAAYYACVMLALLRARWIRPAVAAAALLLWIIVAPATLARTFGDGRLHVTMMDVGQGDATLVTMPDGRTLMIDAGGVSLSGEFDIGDRVLGPALRARGLGRLDYLAITHGDPDHIGGAASLVRDFAPREIWYGTYVNNHQPMMMLQSLALRTRAAWRWLQRGDRLDIGGVEVRIHHPAPEDWQRQKVRNDDSLVIELRYGQVSTLMTGDIGREVEQALLPTLDLLPIVILKSPHHGSGTSSSDEFIAVSKPRIVLISCGRANPYGHPVRPVLARYDAVQSRIYRTDMDGQIEVITDGITVRVDTFRGRHAHSAQRVETHLAATP